MKNKFFKHLYLNSNINKKGELLSVWWIFVLAVIALGIVIGVSVYYSAEVNINLVHADILGNRIAKCLIQDGKILYDMEKYDFFKECKINKKLFNEGDFFVKILINYDDKIIYDKNYGNSAYEKDCQILEKISSKSNLRCVKKKEIAEYNDKEVVLEIISGINQEGGRISLTNE
ncbi:MAG: hypothetical protein AABW83_01575 [Nanoarchaeota archaeon]